MNRVELLTLSATILLATNREDSANRAPEIARALETATILANAAERQEAADNAGVTAELVRKIHQHMAVRRDEVEA